MAYRIEFLPAAARDFRRLPPAARRQLDRGLRALAEDPRPPGVKALRGFKGLLRARTGDYRIVYRIEEDRLVVLVIAIGDRKDIYERLRRRLEGPDSP